MERKTQLFFRDNNKFVFRPLELKYSCLLEKDGEKLVRAWRHTYSGQYDFPGYKNISADTVTLGFNRDIFLDPHNKIPKSIDPRVGKPVEGGVAKWIAKVSEDQRQTYRSKRENHTMNDYINYALIGVISLMTVGWLAAFLVERLSHG